MKIIVTHDSPDMDAITSVWLIKKYLPGWDQAIVKFVPAGERFVFRKTQNTQKSGVSDNQTIGQSDSPSFSEFSEVIERIGEDEAIHVDTGMGPLDHHQTASDKVCAASRTFDFVKEHIGKEKIESIGRMVKVVVDIDHFKEVFRKDPLADYHEFDLASILDGLKFQFPNQNDYYIEFISKALDAVLHAFENRIWAEREIEKNGKKFNTRFGKGIGFETINDSVIKLAQKMGYVIVVRKDPRKGYVRIKAAPDARQPRVSDDARLQNSENQSLSSASLSKIRHQSRSKPNFSSSESGLPRSASEHGIDLTLVYEKLKKMDPSATWFLHVSKKMLLNGSIKNPKMRPTKLSIQEIMKVLEQI